MKYKIIFGIILPLIIIISLALVSNLGQLSIKQDFVKQLSLNDLLENKKVKDTIKLGEVGIENKYFLPKRYDLTQLGACLRDTSGGKAMVDAGTIEYSEGDLPYSDKYVYDYQQDRSIEISSKNIKKINVYLRPSGSFSYLNYSQLKTQYGSYDELIIFEKDNYNQQYPTSRTRIYNCYDLNQDSIDNSIHITILK
ncbi:Uncharacterised protein [uncultured archaeon]|nr:Uncharacterised protein [uncultured archaeon]